MVSTVSDALDTVTRDYDANKIVEVIRTPGERLRSQIDAIRERFHGELATHGDLKRAKLAIDPAKKQLPAVTWSGTFTVRKSEALKNHTGLLCADLDNLGGKLEDTRVLLLRSPYLWALFLSPTAAGLKAVFRAPADGAKHHRSFCAVRQHVKELTSEKVDEACKDVARLCFLSYDPEIFFNPDAIEIEPLLEPEKPRSVSNGQVDLSARQQVAGEVLGHIDWESESEGFTTCPGKRLHSTTNRLRDCKVDLDRAPTVHCFHDSCRGILDGVNREI